MSVKFFAAGMGAHFGGERRATARKKWRPAGAAINHGVALNGGAAAASYLPHPIKPSMPFPVPPWFRRALARRHGAVILFLLLFLAVATVWRYYFLPLPMVVR